MPAIEGAASLNYDVNIPTSMSLERLKRTQRTLGPQDENKSSAHGTVLLGLFSDPVDQLTAATMHVLETASGAMVEQSSSSRHRVPDYSVQAQTGAFNFELTRWKTIGRDPDEEVKMKGRLIGGCLDRIPRLTGTKYGNISEFVKQNQSDGVILYLENGGLRPAELAITLMGLKLNSWFDSLNGILIGRNSGVDCVFWST